MKKYFLEEMGILFMLSVGEVFCCSGVFVLILYFYEIKGFIESYCMMGN